MNQSQFKRWDTWMKDVFGYRSSKDEFGKYERYSKALDKIKFDDYDIVLFTVVMEFRVYDFQFSAAYDHILAQDPFHITPYFALIDEYHMQTSSLEHVISNSPIFYNFLDHDPWRSPRDITLLEMKEVMTILENGCLDYSKYYLSNIKPMILKTQKIKTLL